MFGVENLLLFIGAGLLLNITPGPDMLYVATRSAMQGRSAGLVSALAIGTGTLAHIAAAAFGLSTLLMVSATAFQAVKWAGAAYLIYLGIRTFISAGNSFEKQQLEPDSIRTIFVQGVIVNVLNPKVALFFLAFLPQFLNTAESILPQIIFLGFVFDFFGTLVLFIVALFFSRVGDVMKRHPKVQHAQKWVTGTVFVSMGVMLGFAEK